MSPFRLEASFDARPPEAVAGVAVRAEAPPIEPLPPDAAGALGAVEAPPVVVVVSAAPRAAWPASALRCFGCSPAQAALTMEMARTRMSVARCQRGVRTLQAPKRTSNPAVVRASFIEARFGRTFNR